MNPLRALGDLLAGRPGPAHVRPFDDEPAVGLPDWADRAVLMRREGHDCRIREHDDALHELGRLIIERDTWKARALTAEARLRHPTNGQQAA